jgi:asparagine synthase (glutamine-hydrolysing)
MRLAQENGLKVLLNGQGADEILGYDYMAAFYFNEMFRRFRFISLINEVRSFIRKQKFGVNFTMQLFGYLLAPKFLRKGLENVKSSWLNRDFVESYSKQSNFTEVFFDCKTLNENVVKHLENKLTHLLRFEDKNSMAFSIETRVPFLDHVLVEESLKIPSNMKIRKGVLKYVLKEAMKDLLPPQIINRNDKIGFETPMKKWFQDERLINLTRDVFSSSSFMKSAYFDRNVVNKMLERHARGEIDASQNLWKALCLTLCFDTFLK